MTRILLFIACIAITLVSSAQQPKHADEVLAEASMQAGKEKKNVFILFHASWCGWCKKMDVSMSDPAVKKYFDDNYVIRHLVVHESKGKENQENPGAKELLAKYKGSDHGIPYWLVFDKDGKLLADSKMRVGSEGLESGENVGCPATSEEVGHFITVLKKTSRLGDRELEKIAERFRLNEN